MEEVPEFAAMINGPIPAPREDDVRASLALFKEKCSKIGTTNCASCVANRKGPRCFLRLYGLFDNTFTPQPHGSMEYGDYQRLVTVDGTPSRA